MTQGAILYPRVCTMYNYTKAKRNFHAVRRCTSHTAFGVSMERGFGVTVYVLDLLLHQPPIPMFHNIIKCLACISSFDLITLLPNFICFDQPFFLFADSILVLSISSLHLHVFYLVQLSYISLVSLHSNKQGPLLETLSTPATRSKTPIKSIK